MFRTKQVNTPDIEKFFKDIRYLTNYFSYISCESNSTLEDMWEELDNTLKAKQDDYQSTMVKIWIGGMILAMIRDDNKYRHNPGAEKFYPCRSNMQPFIDQYWSFDKTKKDSISYLGFLGNEALKNPALFNGNLFKLNAHFFGHRDKCGEMFPGLSGKTSLIDTILAYTRLAETKKNEPLVSPPRSLSPY